jgi:hypothetical protein
MWNRWITCGHTILGVRMTIRSAKNYGSGAIEVKCGRCRDS